jgi:MFS transporter, DHA3 family, macrolide efflux protein
MKRSVPTEPITNQKPRVFQNRNYRLLFWGVLVSNVAHILFGFAISLYILELAKTEYGKDTAALIQASYLFVSGIILVLFVPLGGVLADRKNKVRIMYITDFIRGGAIVLVGLFIALDTAVLWKIVALFVMNVILSINSSFFQPAGSSLLRFIVSDEELQPAAAYLQGSNSFQSIIGLVLGGILYATLHISWLFFLNGIGYIISAITEIFIVYDHKSHAQATASTKEVLYDIRDGIRYIFANKGVLAILTMALLFNFFVNPTFSNAMPIFIKFGLTDEPRYLFDQVLEPSHWYSIMSIAISISAIIMSLILSTRKTKERYGPDLKRALIGFTIPILVISLIMILYYQALVDVNVVLLGVTAMMFLLGFANVSFNIPVSLIMQRQVDRQMLGKVSSVSSVLSQALIPFSSLIAGLIIANTSISVLYLACSLGVIGVSFWFVKNKAADTI